MLEDDPAFDAGHGAVLTARGDVELDAVVSRPPGQREQGVEGGGEGVHGAPR